MAPSRDVAPPAAARDEARAFAAAFRGRRVPLDAAFDRFLAAELREVSAHYWSPLRVVRQAAAWLRDIQVRDVVDVGSGAGKFCVAAALLTRCRFVGLEKRAALAEAARELAETFGVGDRVTFVTGDLASSRVPAADAYYLFNPFGEYAFHSRRFADPAATFTPEAQARDVEAATALLSRARPGTFVITLNGIGGPLPGSYEQLDVARRLPGTLRLWKKRV
jgi:SAM-dependent methyltransferase